MEIALDKESPIQGIVSKRLDRVDDAGKCKHWIKINRSITTVDNLGLEAAALTQILTTVSTMP
jgi:hypothetical protein